jgi:hypothetical protein
MHFEIAGQITDGVTANTGVHPLIRLSGAASRRALSFRDVVVEEFRVSPMGVRPGLPG